MPWWLGGLLLAGVMLAHWYALHRQMAVSGRFTALVNRWRFGRPDDSVALASQEQLIEAMRAMTAAEFGDAEVDKTAAQEPVELDRPSDVAASEQGTVLPVRERHPMLLHLLFLAGLVGGGLLSGIVSRQSRLELSLQSDLFAEMFGGHSWLGPTALLVGGVLVGFGTRMASGCTSGHGLCGVSRFQKGSLLATVCFFGSGVVASLLLGVVG